MALAPDLPEAHSALALCALHYAFDRDAAIASFERAYELGPNNALVAGYRMTYLHHILRQRPDDAIREGTATVALDPLNASSLSRLANAYLVAGRAEEGLPVARRAIEVDPLSHLAQTAIVFSLGDSGDPTAAIQAAEESLARTGRHQWMLAFLANLLSQVGDREGAAAIYGEAMARSKREYIQPGVLAIAAASCGQEDECIDHCHAAIDARDMVVLFFLAPGFPFVRNVRAAARFNEVPARVGWGMKSG